MRARVIPISCRPSIVRWQATLTITALGATIGCSADLKAGNDDFGIVAAGQNTGPGDWRCLDDAPPTPVSAPESVKYTLPVVDWANARLPLASREIKVCGLVDVDCVQPISKLDPSSSESNVQLQIPGGEPVYLSITQPARIPETLRFDGPLFSDQEGARVPMLTPSVLAELATQQGVTPDPALGVIALSAYDCAGNPATDIYFQMDATGIAFTAKNSVPVVTAPGKLTSSTVQPTEAGNIPFAGFANVAPGHVNAFGFLGDERRLIGDASFFVRPGEITIAEVRALDHL